MQRALLEPVLRANETENWAEGKPTGDTGAAEV